MSTLRYALHRILPVRALHLAQARLFEAWWYRMADGRDSRLLSGAHDALAWFNTPYRPARWTTTDSRRIHARVEAARKHAG